MPIYEFYCPRCEQEFEQLVIKKDEKVTCPKCDCAKVTRLLSGFAHKSGEEGSLTSASSGCAGCKATSCATCH